MNFLAHIYLSGENPRLMAGNFIGDFVKGRNLLQQFDAEVAAGVELHRAIDHYTDHHPVVKQSKMRLWTKYRHYSAVLVDVFYDHFLSRYWHDFSDVSIADYATDKYAILKSLEFMLPVPVRQLLPYMIRQNWLVNYGNFDGLQQTLNGMAQRTRHESGMEKSLADLQENYDAYRQEFHQFLPDLIQHCNAIIAQAGLNLIAYPKHSTDAQ